MIDSVVYVPVVDLNTEVNMFRAGEIDITNSVPPEIVRNPGDEIASNLRVAPELALYYIAFDMTEPPMDNVELRRALSMAIDRQTIVSILGRGEIPAYGVVPPGVDGYEGPAYDWRSLGATERIAAARDAYRSAGYSDENPLSLRLLYDTGDVHATVASAVAAMWSDELGAEVETENREWAYFLDSRSRRDEWDAMRFAWIGDYNSPMTFLEIFTSESPQNLARYRSEEFDSKLRDATMTTDNSVALEQMHGAESVLIEDYPVAPIYFFVSKHLVSDRIAGFEDNALNRHPSRFLSIRTDRPR
jgi:oligopeptide transport system substrate-binding protein